MIFLSRRTKFTRPTSTRATSAPSVHYSADRIEKIPYLSLVRPKGTFYLFPGVEKTGLDDKQFCKELLERAHVLVSAGSPFGKTGANHFRIACTVGIDQLKQAFDRMEKLEF